MIGLAVSPLCPILAGGVEFEWYLSISIFFYLLYPLLFKLPRFLLIVGASVLALSIQLAYINEMLNLTILQACGLARLPMFCWGIAIFKENEENEMSTNTVFIFWFIMLVVSILTRQHLFFLADFMAPFLTVGLISCMKRIEHTNVYEFLKKIGMFTLEIYVGNMISLIICKKLPDEILPRLVIYFVCTAILSYMMIIINKHVQKRIAKLIVLRKS